ncbi:hypothetical protein C8F01DRAFT_1141493 [Mycena amicta]|nr:hypothetical protein C8F01DRAFT_1141493 [Mycena amicta]
MHQCELCGKEFPRPSGLLIHMNSHTNERRYTCKLLSCGRSFNVLSNARRHYRTHGIEPPASLRASRRRGYVVNFEAPITPQLPPPSVPSQAPFQVRWVELNVVTRRGLRQAEPDVDFDPRHQPVDKSW